MELNYIDLIVIFAFFLSMVIIGVYAYFKNRDSEDFFVAGGNLPWWLSGISHHVSGYSGAVFVAYAALAYTHGMYGGPLPLDLPWLLRPEYSQ